MAENEISEKIVAALPKPERGNKLHYFSGAMVQGKKAPSGFAVRVTAAGSKAFVWFHRVNGKGHLETIGSWRGNEAGGELSVVGAIDTAAKRAEAVAKGFTGKGKNIKEVNPLPARTRRLVEAGLPAERNVSGLLDIFIRDHVEKNLRSKKIVTQCIERLVKPKIGDLGINEIKRSHVKKMLNEIAKENGEVLADRVLAYVRKAFNWYEVNSEDDDFKSPVVRGMAITKPSDHARKRVLTDDEIRAVWRSCGETGAFGLVMRFILLTATRRNEAGEMLWSETGVDPTGTHWIIPAERYKTKRDHVIPLSDAALDVLSQIKRTKADLVFASDGGFAVACQAKLKTDLDTRSGVKDWTIHDLRRTARTLMARAGITEDHAERCLGHVIGGVRGVYNRFEYLDEKRAAFEKLARTVDTIINPRASNVVAMSKQIGA